MMPASPEFPSIAADGPRPHPSRLIRLGIAFSACIAMASVSGVAGAQTAASSLSSRDDLTAAAAQLESRNPMEAAAVRQRLRDGDFQVGDRIIVSVFTDVARVDTLVVRAGRVIDLPGKSVLPLSGVLRSELKDLVNAEVLKYVKNVQVDVIPLTRIGVLGEVTRPGYFASRSDVPITDAIMLAGGPTNTADIERTIVRRVGREYRSAQETRQAVAKGLTLDQFGLSAGDELVVGRQRQLITPTTSAVLGLAASIAAVFFAARH